MTTGETLLSLREHRAEINGSMRQALMRGDRKAGEGYRKLLSQLDLRLRSLLMAIEPPKGAPHGVKRIPPKRKRAEPTAPAPREMQDIRPKVRKAAAK